LVTSAEGCQSAISVVVTVIKPIIIPNAFTPNGDNVNDTWIIPYLDYYSNCSVDIFTRYGQNIFHSKGYPIPWNGTYNGNRLPVGTYYYIVDLKNGIKPLFGFVTIIR
jgi:gliding motility-associated-like protein